MEHIAISVIVPIYNTKPYLEECIESILDQKINVPVEVLLIDDGSTDGCADLCDRYAARPILYQLTLGKKLIQHMLQRISRLLYSYPS